MLFKYIKKVIKFGVSVAFYLCPVKDNKILFINFNGKGYGCNPKYIAQEILNQKLASDIVWLVNNSEEALPKGIRKVPYKSLWAMYEVATAKVIVTNVKNDLRLLKKKKQYIIQTWHGSYSSKFLEREAEGKLAPSYLIESKRNSAQTDLFLSNSRVLSQCYRDAFWCECEIMECGFPRNDMLFNTDIEEVNRIKESLSVSASTKLILYAPTFRDDGSCDAYSIDCIGVLNALRENGDDWKLLTRLHPNVNACDKLFPEDENIINANLYPDMQELLLVSDILITDYSSTPFEFAAMQKQVYIYAPDIEEYQRIRGLKDDFFNMPYHICRTNADLLRLVSRYKPESAVTEAKLFMERFGGVDRGDASKQVVERIKRKLLVS